MDELNFESWQAFRGFLDEDRQVFPVYWRGQPFDRSKPISLALASTFEREILGMAGGHLPEASMLYPYDGRLQRDGKPIWSEGFYEGIRDRYLQSFERLASGLRGPNPAELDVDQWWALGRHYGLVSPLLDWTEKPYIAAFFALSRLWQEMTGPGGTVVFEENRVAIYRLFHNKHLEGDGLRIVQVTVEELGRMQAQHGVFTWLESERFFELQGFLDNTGRENLLTRIVLSDQTVVDGLRDLSQHGISHRYLLPDLSGAAEDANLSFDMPL